MVKSRKSAVIYNGIDEAPTTVGKLRKELNIEDDVLIIGTTMRLREPKQPIYTIQVLNEILVRVTGLNWLLLVTDPCVINASKP